MKTKLIIATEEDEKQLDELINEFIADKKVLNIHYTSVIHQHIESYGWYPNVQHNALIVYETK